MRSSLKRAAFWVQIAFVTFADSQLVEPTSKDNSPECDCYLTSGPDPGFFQYHRFWDFRNVSGDGSDDDYTVAPPLITDSENNGAEPVSSPYFNTSAWVRDWDIQTGQQGRNGSVPTYNSAQNIYISRNSTPGANNSTYLTLRASRLADFSSICEIDSNQMNLLHSSIRVRARIIPNGLSNASDPSSGNTALDNTDAGSNASHPVSNGAVWGFFTYHSDTQESDIEILTDDATTQIHYSNQPDYDAKTDTSVPDATTELSLPDGLVWTEWVEHRIDWFDGIARWYVNDELVENKTKNAEVMPSGLIINLWSDGGSWSGNMSVGSQVTVGIEWIDMVFNVSGNVNGNNGKRIDAGDLYKRGSSHCDVGCNVDGIKNVGFPEVSFNVSSSATSLVWTHDGGGRAFTHSVVGFVVLVSLFVL